MRSPDSQQLLESSRLSMTHQVFCGIDTLAILVDPFFWRPVS
jgi:hypothetical protein